MFGKIYVSAFVHAASFASMVGLLLTLKKLDAWAAWQKLAFVAVSIAFIFALALEIISAWQNRVRRYKKGSPKIQKFMTSWIKNSGRVAILSRDLSWTDEESVQTLEAKAKKNELLILIEKPTYLTNELQKMGATIVNYQNTQHVPASRFTIVGYERAGARVAIGGTDNDHHLIQIFSEGNHPLFAVANDLVKFVAGKTSI